MFSDLLSKISTLNNFYIFSILFLFVICCYGVTLGNGLFFDDEHFIYKNEAVKNLDLTTLFSKSLSSGSGEVSNYYRPLLFTGFSLEYQLFNDNGFIYHLNSFLLHFLGSILLFLLIKKLFENRLLALLTSLLFLIHPIQTEAISYASGRGDPLSFFFIISTLLLLLSKKKNYRLMSFVTLGAALLSKEIALMTPGLIFLVYLFSQRSFTKETLIKSFIQTLPYAIITGSYFILRITVLNFSNTLNFYNAANIYSSNLLVRLQTFFNVFPTYVGLLIYPKSLFMERDSGIQIMTSFNLRIIVSIISIIVALCLSAWKRKSDPIILFSILWVAVTFVPTSGILPINGIFYEHFLFFPSVGFFLLLSHLFLLLYKRATHIFKEILCLLLFLCIITLCVRTISRNLEWHDPITFYTQTLSHVQSARAFNNLAMAYAESEKPHDAISTYKKAIALSDTYPETHYNLGNVYASIQDTSNAEKEYKKALSISPQFYLSYITLYSIYKSTNNKEGLDFVHENLSSLGKSNPQFVVLLNQLEKN